MVNLVEYPDLGILELTIDGGISRADYGAVVGAVEHLLETHRRISLLEVVSDLSWIEPAGWWTENIAHLSTVQFVDRIAVISEKGQIGPVARAFAGYFPSEIRVFRSYEAHQARIWLSGSAVSTRRANTRALACL